MYWALHKDLDVHLSHHLMSVARMPRGRAEQAGSQQCQFSMEIPSKMAAAKLLEGWASMGNTKIVHGECRGADRVEEVAIDRELLPQQ